MHLPVTGGQDIFFLFLPHHRGDTAGWVEYLDFPLVHPFKSEQTQSLYLGRKAKDRRKKINHQATKSREGRRKYRGEEHALYVFCCLFHQTKTLRTQVEKVSKPRLCPAPTLDSKEAKQRGFFISRGASCLGGAGAPLKQVDFLNKLQDQHELAFEQSIQAFTNTVHK